MDSPGHCAQYCTYTVMENDSREIISVVTVDKRQTGRNSVIMEREAFVQTVDILMKEVKLVEVCTDAHVQISALMSKLPLFWTDGGWGGGHYCSNCTYYFFPNKTKESTKTLG